MKKDRMILGENAACSLDSKKTGRNNNILVCGGSGSGKTVSIMEPRLLETSEDSLIVTVTKRRIVEKYTPFFEARGYKVEELNFVSPEKSLIAYDPLRYIKKFQDITYLATAIVMADGRKEDSHADPYWDHAAISLFSAEIAYTLATKKNPTFADVLAFHDRLEISGEYSSNSSIGTTVDEAFSSLPSRGKLNQFARSCWSSFSSLPGRTAGCVYGTLNTTLDTIFSPELRKMITCGKQIEIEKLGTEKRVLFMSSSAVNPSLHCFVNLFYAQAIKQLFEFAERQPDGKLPVPVHILCDDFATGCRILNFQDYISVFREKQISATLLVQSESQLAGIYGQSDAKTIINNCDTYLYFGGMDIETARHVSERMNLPLEDILCLPIGDVCIFQRGEHPRITQRYNVNKDARYRKATAAYEKQVLEKKRLMEKQGEYETA